MSQARILLVEDEASIRIMLQHNLEAEGYEVVCAPTGKTALQKLRLEHFDLMILDLMLPEISGLDILEIKHLENISVPTIIVSAKGSASERVAGLKMGAEDYVTKPFDLEELLLRIDKILARRTLDLNNNEDSITIGNNTIDFTSFEANTNQGVIQLTKTEAAILRLLHSRKNQVVSRKDILNSVYGFDVFPNTRTIDNFILAFRKYFEENPKEPKYFKSIRGIGYKLIL